MELTGEHLLTLDELITLLSISDDFTIAFVRCNELILRNALSTTIKKRMRDDIYIYNIKMGEDATNLLQLLNDAVTSELYSTLKEENKKIAFFIYGLDEAVEKKNQQGRSEALLLLNMMREDFQKIQHPLIIWINKASLILILKEAQDFFSWRTTVFEFDMEHEKEIRQITDFGDTALCETNGQVYGITNEKARACKKIFEDLEGIDITAPAAVTAACLIDAVDEGSVGKDDCILLNITAGGVERLKEDYSLFYIEPEVSLDSVDVDLDLIF